MRINIWPYIIIALSFIYKLYLAKTFPIWYDEAFTISLLTKSWPDFWQIIKTDVHPPLYYFFVTPFTSIYGYSLFVVRYFSAVASSLSVFFAYQIIKNYITAQNKQNILIALLAFNPFFAFYGAEARSYAFFILCYVLSLFFCINAVKTNNVWHKAGLSVSLLTLFYSNLLGIVGVATVGLTYILLGVQKTEKSLHIRNIFQFIKESWQEILLICMPFIVGLIFWLNIITTLYASSPSGIWWLKPANIGSFFESIQYFLFGVNHHITGTIPAAKIWGINQILTVSQSGFIFFLIISFLVFKNRNIFKKDEGFMILCINSVLPLLIFLFSSIVLQKHFYMGRFLAPYGFIFVIFIFYVMLKSKKLPFRIKQALLAIYVVFCFVGVKRYPNFYQYTEETTFLQENSHKYKEILTDTAHNHVVMNAISANKVKKRSLKGRYEEVASWAIILEDEIVNSYHESKLPVLLIQDKTTPVPNGFNTRKETEKYRFSEKR